jgi:hypothetical protein
MAASVILKSVWSFSLLGLLVTRIQIFDPFPPMVPLHSYPATATASSIKCRSLSFMTHDLRRADSFSGAIFGEC